VAEIDEPPLLLLLLLLLLLSQLLLLLLCMHSCMDGWMDGCPHLICWLPSRGCHTVCCSTPSLPPAIACSRSRRHAPLRCAAASPPTRCGSSTLC
jgi:hypothetical protein